MVDLWLSRYLPEARGDNVHWDIGEKAIFVGIAGAEHRVTIQSEVVRHASSGGKICREVSFDDEDDAIYCVPAEQLRWL